MRLSVKKYTQKKLACIMPRAVRRFKSDDSGATAVEFALVGFPFFLLVSAILESSIYFLANQYAETMVDDIMRMYRTGELGAETTVDDLRTQICKRTVALFDCNKFSIKVEAVAEYNLLKDPPKPDMEDEDQNFPPDEYPPAEDLGPSTIMQISLSYKWPLLTNYAAPMAYQSGGKFALMSVTAVTLTEPF